MHIMTVFIEKNMNPYTFSLHCSPFKMFTTSRHMYNIYIATYDYYKLKQKHQMLQYYTALFDSNILILSKVVKTS